MQPHKSKFFTDFARFPHVFPTHPPTHLQRCLPNAKSWRCQTLAIKRNLFTKKDNSDWVLACAVFKENIKAVNSNSWENVEKFAAEGAAVATAEDRMPLYATDARFVRYGKESREWKQKQKISEHGAT